MGVLCNGICQAIRSSDIIYKGWQRAVPQIIEVWRECFKRCHRDKSKGS